MILSCRKDLKEYAATMKAVTIVTTNGCFDILHAGHISFLKQAAQYGEILIVGVNSDESVTSLKGNGRPLVPLRWRMRAINELEFVDIVHPFNEDTPKEFLSEVQPDIHCKGVEYLDQDIPEVALLSSWGGTVKYLAHKYDISTTDILKNTEAPPTSSKLEAAVDWVLNDMAYKAPEQIGPELAERWRSRLLEGSL